MKIKIFIFFLLSFSLLSFNSRAESATVYCATIDGNAWDWLYDENGDYTSVQGQWGTKKVNRSRSFVFFDISYDDYVKYQKQCEKEGMVPQPATSRHSDWYIFRINFTNGKKIFAQGYYSLLRNMDDAFIYRVQ